MTLAELQHAAEQRWRAHWLAGPTRRRWMTPPLQVGDAAPDFELLDSEGQRRQLGEFWRDQPAMVIFWRHFGCGCGVGRAERLVNEYAKLMEAGAEVVLIGQGEPERAAWYRDRFKIPTTLLVDPDEHVYRAYGLLETSPWLLLGRPTPDVGYFDEIMVKHRELGRPVADNPFLLPGEFVVDRTGHFVLAYRAISHACRARDTFSRRDDAPADTGLGPTGPPRSPPSIARTGRVRRLSDSP